MPLGGGTKTPHNAPGFDIPQDQCAVACPGNKLRAIRVNGDRENVVVIAAERADCGAGGRIPQHDQGVVSAGKRVNAIRQKRDAAHTRRVSVPDA